jgi:cell division septal protein FtsQ
MPLFRRKNKKKQGKNSQISNLRSPYRQKNISLSRKFKKSKSLPTLPYSSRMKKEPGFSHRFKVILTYILSLGIAIYGTYALLFSDFFNIQNFIIEEKGTIIEDYQKMKTILSELLEKNLILVDDYELKNKIQQFHPEMAKIKIVKIFPKTIKIEYEKYPTVANLVNIVEGIQKRFLLDSQGFITEENSDQLDLPYIYLSTKNALNVRESFLENPKKSAEKLKYILDSIYLFEEKFIIKVLYAEFLPVEREVHLRTEKYFDVLIDMQKNLNRQIEKLQKAHPTIDMYNMPLLYIDLRISGTDTEKVIYKRK